MPPTDDDQSAERESRIEEMMKGHRREQPSSPSPNAEDQPSGPGRSRDRRRRRERRGN
jgi:hypothetical protein